MTIDYQSVVNLAVNCLLYAFPFALIFMIAQKLLFLFISFVFGKEVNF